MWLYFLEEEKNMRAKIIQEFKGEINDVKFINEQVYRTSEYLIENIAFKEIKMETMQKGVFRWYQFKNFQIKNEYIDNSIILKLLDYNIDFDKWDTFINNSFLIITENKIWILDNKENVYNIPIDKIEIYILEKEKRKRKYKYSFSIVKKYLHNPFSLNKIMKILSIDLKEKLKTDKKRFYIGYFIQCEPF